MENEWKVSINSLDQMLTSEVFIYRPVGKDEIQWLEFNSPDVTLHQEKYPYGSVMPVRPAFVVRTDEAIGIAKGFVAYANSQGFKNGTETFVKGKLEATEAHLDDMRRLVFKDKYKPN